MNGQYGYLVCHHQKGENCWPYPPYECKVLMITNTNVIYAWVCCSNRLQMLFEILWNCLVNYVQEQVWEQVLKIRCFKNPEQPRDQFYRVFATASCLSTRCPVDSTRILVWYKFYFLRLLLIYHWESLNLTYTLKWFHFGEMFQNTISDQFWKQGV